MIEIKIKKMIPHQQPNQDPSQQPQEGGAVEAAGMNEMNQKLSELSERETEELVKSFQDHFNDCTKACKKPNILVAGITGAGMYFNSEQRLYDPPTILK